MLKVNALAFRLIGIQNKIRMILCGPYRITNQLRIVQSQLGWSIKGFVRVIGLITVSLISLQVLRMQDVQTLVTISDEISSFQFTCS